MHAQVPTTAFASTSRGAGGEGGKAIEGGGALCLHATYRKMTLMCCEPLSAGLLHRAADAVPAAVAPTAAAAVVANQLSACSPLWCFQDGGPCGCCWRPKTHVRLFQQTGQNPSRGLAVVLHPLKSPKAGVDVRVRDLLAARLHRRVDIVVDNDRPIRPTRSSSRNRGTAQPPIQKRQSALHVAECVRPDEHQQAAITVLVIRDLRKSHIASK